MFKNIWNHGKQLVDKNCFKQNYSIQKVKKIIVPIRPKVHLHTYYTLMIGTILLRWPQKSKILNPNLECQ